MGNYIGKTKRSIRGNPVNHHMRSNKRRIFGKIDFYNSIGISHIAPEVRLTDKSRDVIANTPKGGNGYKSVLKAYINAQQSMGKVTLAQNAITPEKPSAPITNSLNQRLYGK